MAIDRGYTTLLEFREHLSEVPSQNDHDSLYEQRVEAASHAVDNYCGLPPGRFLLDSAVSARTYYARDPYCLMIDPVGTLTGAIVKTGTGNGTFGTTLTITTNYIFEPLNALADGEPVTHIRRSDGAAWPTSTYGAPNVEVTAKWGWPVLPAPVKTATLLAAADLWKRKDAPFGIDQNPNFGPIYISKDTLRSVTSLLNRYGTGSSVGALV